MMTDPRLREPVEKTDLGYRQVQDRCTKLRRAGTIPYGWISDATRRGYYTHTFTGAADFLRRMNGLYRSDIWTSAQTYCEVWCEFRSIAGVIAADCEELAVSLYPAGGFSSITLAYQAAEYITQETRFGEKPAVVLYIGDYDPAGVLIDVSLERELREHLGAGIHLDFERIAITEGQIERYDLPRKPRKKTEKRALHVDCAVEAEAMPARILRQLLRERIENLLPRHALEVARAAEASEREHLTFIANLLGDAT
jgi:hypothetical protein